MKRTTDYEAHDGKRFATAEECKEHEKKIKLLLLRDLHETAIMAAVERANVELADAIEFAGSLIAEKRRADGELRRKKNTAPPTPAPKPPSVSAIESKSKVTK
jgi:hypothetical protein